MKLNLGKPLAFFDLETTGLSVTKDRIGLWWHQEILISVVKQELLNEKTLSR